jgi:hypothetical protein
VAAVGLVSTPAVPVLTSALDASGTAPRSRSSQSSLPYPTDCAKGPVNSVAPNYDPQDPPPDTCEVCLEVSVLDSTRPGGVRFVGEICGLDDGHAAKIHSVMSWAMYCGVIVPAHDWEDLGGAYSPPLMVEAVRLPPCAPAAKEDAPEETP